MFNIIRLRLLSDWEEDVKMKDCMAILILLLMCSFSNFFVDSALAILGVISKFVNNIVSIFDYSKLMSSEELNLTLLNVNDTMLGDLGKIMVFSLFSIIPVVIGMIIKKNKMGLPITILMIIGFNCFQNMNVTIFMAIICIFLITLTWIVPIGSGKYFNTLAYIAYFLNMYPIKIKIDNLNAITVLKFIGKGIIRILLPIFLYTYLLAQIINNINIVLAIQIYFGIILLIFLNYSKNEVSLSLRRIVIYLFIVFLTAVNIDNKNMDIVSILLSAFAILFSLNRVLSAINDIKKEVENNSCLYAFDHKSDDNDWLVHNFIDYHILKNTQVSENLLLRQIIIHYLLSDDKTLEMINIYKQSYKKNIMLVKQLEFMEIYEYEDISLKSKLQMYKDCFVKDNKSYSNIQALIKYCFLLTVDGQYDKCIEVLSEWFGFLDNYSKYILYYSYLKTDKEKEASWVKDNIDDFIDVESEFVGCFNN